MTKIFRKRIDAIVSLVLVAVVLGLAFVINRSNNTTSENSPTPSTTYSPAIPTSEPGAKAYIDRASEEVAKNNYRAAVTILAEAIQEYPDDQNLQLTKEYYEREALRYGQ